MLLLGEKAYALLRNHGIPVVESKYIAEPDLNKLAVPCVLKAPEVTHKTESGAVKIVYCKEELLNTYRKISKKGKVLWQPYVDGHQLIIGIKNDPAFKQVILLGAGGIYAELLKDTAFRVCPITEKDSEEMISELRYSSILKGVRGQKSAKLQLLKETLVKVSKLAIKENIQELDINPFIINDKQGYCVDARIVK